MTLQPETDGSPSVTSTAQRSRAWALTTPTSAGRRSRPIRFSSGPIGLGYYGKPTAPHGWLDGDLNGDGKVDGDDIGLIIGTGTYNNGAFAANAAAVATPTLTLPRSTKGGESQSIAEAASSAQTVAPARGAPAASSSAVAHQTVFSSRLVRGLSLQSPTAYRALGDQADDSAMMASVSDLSHSSASASLGTKSVRKRYPFATELDASSIFAGDARV